MMTFEQTVRTLYDNWEKGYVYVMRAYDNDSSLGVRASYYNDLHNDPVIDDQVFMIAGSLYETHTGKFCKRIPVFMEDPDEFLVVNLTAESQSLAPVFVKVELGQYKITSREVVEEDEYEPTVVRIGVERIH